MIKRIGFTKRSWRTFAFLIAGLFILSFTLTKLKYLYYTQQKYNRLQNYKEYVIIF